MPPLDPFTPPVLDPDCEADLTDWQLVPADGANSENRRLLASLLPSGVDVTVDLNPETFHQKYIVRDLEGSRTAVLTGSTNFTPTGLGRNLNHLVMIKGRRVARIYAEEFEEMWHGTFGGLRTRHDRKPTKSTVAGVPIRVLFAPGHAPEMEIMKWMLKANSSIRFAMFTFSNSSGIDDTMQVCANAGTLDQRPCKPEVWQYRQ